jgi:hypothetical protein
VVAIPRIPLDRSAIQTKTYLTTGVENSLCVAVLHRAGNKIEGATLRPWRLSKFCSLQEVMVTFFC